MKMKVMGVLLCGWLALGGGALWGAQVTTAEQCPTKILKTGTLEGVLLEVSDEGETCEAAQIKLDNGGTEWVCFTENDETKRLFGKTGSRVSIDYNDVQFWHEGSESCQTTFDLVKSPAFKFK